MGFGIGPYPVLDIGRIGRGSALVLARVFMASRELPVPHEESLQGPEIERRNSNEVERSSSCLIARRFLKAPRLHFRARFGNQVS